MGAVPLTSVVYVGLTSRGSVGCGTLRAEILFRFQKSDICENCVTNKKGSYTNKKEDKKLGPIFTIFVLIIFFSTSHA